jgi:hypothetical protein
MFKWQICYTEMTDLLQFTIDIRKSHRETQCTLKLVCTDSILFVWADLHVSLCEQQHLKRERAFRLAYPPLFLIFAFHPTPQKKSNGVWSGDSNTSISITIQ